MPGHRKKKHTGQFPRSTTSPTQEVEEAGGTLQQNVATTCIDDAPGSANPTVEVEVEVAAQTLEELLQYPDITGLSTQQIIDVLKANCALRSQKREELGADEYDRQEKEYDERIIEKGKPSFIFRNVILSKNGLQRAVDELSKKGSAQYTIEEEYLVVRTVCLLALRKIKGYMLEYQFENITFQHNFHLFRRKSTHE